MNAIHVCESRLDRDLQTQARTVVLMGSEPDIVDYHSAVTKPSRNLFVTLLQASDTLN